MFCGEKGSLQVDFGRIKINRQASHERIYLLYTYEAFGTERPPSKRAKKLRDVLLRNLPHVTFRIMLNTYAESHSDHRAQEENLDPSGSVSQ